MGIPNFRTSIQAESPNFYIYHLNHILAIGSCFAQNIGNQLNKYKFSTLLNPFGILYNPISIQKALERIINNNPIEKNSLFHHRSLWQHFDFHSQFAHADFDLAFRQMNQAIEKAHLFLHQTDRLLLTLGTANVFRNNTSGDIVANCHKLPNKKFTKQRLSTSTIIDSLSMALNTLHSKLPHLQIIISVSPIRHLKDGFIENQRSKATLLLAASELEKQFYNVCYFPAYEIMMDDLRDYRFYQKDMLHPNEVALDYIWDLFQNSFFRAPTSQLIGEIDAILKASQHRPLHPEAHTELSTFAERQLKKIAEIKNVNNLLDFTNEEAHFKALLS